MKLILQKDACAKSGDFAQQGGRWEGNDPQYNNGSSDNFKKYWEYRETLIDVQAAKKTWSGKRAVENGYETVKIVEESENLILVEFTK